MTRSPRVDFACRFFPKRRCFTSHRAPCAGRDRDRAGPIAIMRRRDRAECAKGSPEHIKAVTSAVDGASIKANTATSKDWPTVGLDYAETRFSKLNQINADNVKKLGLVWSYKLESSRGVEATPIVVDGIMYADRVVERGPRHRRPHRQADLDLRSRGVDARRATEAAATSSIAASRSTRARSSSAPMTAG